MIGFSVSFWLQAWRIWKEYLQNSTRIIELCNKPKPFFLIVGLKKNDNVKPLQKLDFLAFNFVAFAKKQEN